MKKYVWLVCAFVAHAAAHADTVRMVVDVTHVSKAVGTRGGDPTPVWTDDASFVPQDFSVVVEFDTDKVHVFPPLPGIITTQFSDARLSRSPYGAALEAALPAEAATMAYGVQHSQQSPDGYRPGDWTTVGTGNFWDDTVDGVFRTRFYSRVLSWQAASPFSPDYSTAPDAPAFLDLLRSYVGTNVGKYSEFYSVDIVKVPRWGASPDDWLTFDAVAYTGEAVIRSISVVPEPGGAVPVLLGLAAVGAALRRRGPRA